MPCIDTLLLNLTWKVLLQLTQDTSVHALKQTQLKCDSRCWLRKLASCRAEIGISPGGSRRDALHAETCCKAQGPKQTSSGKTRAKQHPTCSCCLPTPSGPGSRGEGLATLVR